MVLQIFQRLSLRPVIGVVEQIPEEGVPVLPVDKLDDLHSQPPDHTSRMNCIPQPRDPAIDSPRDIALSRQNPLRSGGCQPVIERVNPNVVNSWVAPVVSADRGSVKRGPEQCQHDIIGNTRAVSLAANAISDAERL